MKKFIRNTLAYTLSGVLFLSSCSDSTVEGNFAYPDDYVRVSAPAELTTIESLTGNTGSVTLESGDIYAVIKIKKYGDITVKLLEDDAPYAVQNFIDLSSSGYFNDKSIHRVIDDFMLQGGSLNGDGTGGTAADGGEFKCEINGNMRHFYGALCYANAAGSNSCQFYIVNNKTPQVVNESFYEEYIATYSNLVGQCEEMAKMYGEGSEGYVYYSAMAETYTDMIKGAELMKDTLNDDIVAKYAEVGGVPFLDGGYTVFGQTIDGFDVIDEITAVEKTTGSDGAESKPVKEIIIDSVTIMIAE